MPYNVTLQGADYADVPAIIVPKTGGGEAKFFADLQPFVLRPDAELIKTYTYDKLIVEDEEVTIPAYTTTDTTLKASENLSPTISISYANYDYRIIQRFLSIPIYNTSTVATGRLEYWMGCYIYDLVEIPANTFQALVNTTKYTSRTSGHYQCGQFYRNVYWTSASALTAYATASYGTIMGATSPSISNSVETIKSPALKIRGHSTYFRSSVWSTVTDIRYQYVIDVYRVPKNSLNIEAFESRQQAYQIIGCANTTNHKLT